MSLTGTPSSRTAHDPLAALLREFEGWRAGLDDGSGEYVPLGRGVHALPGGDLLAAPRLHGDSRYPHTREGFNLWTCASGYIHANDGLFSVFPRRMEGQEPSIAFFSGGRAGNDGWEPVSLLGVPHPPVPRPAAAGPFTLFTPAKTVYFSAMEGYSALVRVHAPRAETLLFTVYMEGGSAPPAEILHSAFFNPMLRHQIHETDEDRWFRQVTLHQPGGPGAAAFRFQINEDKDRHTSLSHFAVVQRGLTALEGAELLDNEETPSRYQYMGSSTRNLSNALSLRRGTFGARREICSFTEPAIAGDLLTFAVQPGFRIRIDYLFERTSTAAEAGELTTVLRSTPGRWEASIARGEERRRRRASKLSLRFGASSDPALDADALTHFMVHLMEQVEFCSLIKGYVQLSENSLIGIRDVFQALEGLAYHDPGAARRKMLEALDYTCPDGRCMRQYSLPKASGETGRMDLRPFIDQGVWVISAMATYLRLTGDVDLLSVECGYFRIVDEASGRVERCSERDSVLDHLRRIVDFLLRNLAPDTGCLRALYGDWNDALDGLGTLPGGDAHSYGDGVSVMATLQLYQNLHEMEEILLLDNAAAHRGEIDHLREAARRLSANLSLHAIQEGPGGGQRIVHGWGHRRSYYAGSFHDADGQARDSLTSNAFWILSGMIRERPGLRPSILAAFDRLDSPYGLKTFHPPFPENESRFGRIGKLPAGTAENGATYVHATAFGIMALFEIGESRRAWRELIKILPFTPGHEGLSHSPFVMPNSYGHNPEKNIDGQNMNDWQTGSSNVVLKMILRHVIGFEMEGDHLRLQPAAYCPCHHWEVRIQARGRAFTIRREYQKGRTRRFLVNGAPMESGHDPVMQTQIARIPLASFEEGAEVDILVED